MVDLSVSFVVYDDYGDVRGAVRSLEENTSPDITRQIYIVDNGSDREGCEAARKSLLGMISDCPDAEYVDGGENLGYARGQNLVLPMLDSVYHAILNPDIVFVEDAFSEILSYMKEKNVDFCIPRLVDEKGNLQHIYRREVTVFDMFLRMFAKRLFKKRQMRHTLCDMDYTKPFPVPFGQGSFLVIRTELFRALGGFDERFFLYMEDADLCRRANRVSQLMYFPGATVVHKWERASHGDKNLRRIHIASMRKYFLKWGWRFF